MALVVISLALLPVVIEEQREYQRLACGAAQLMLLRDPAFDAVEEQGERGHTAAPGELNQLSGNGFSVGTAVLAPLRQELAQKVTEGAVDRRTPFRISRLPRFPRRSRTCHRLCSAV